MPGRIALCLAAAATVALGAAACGGEEAAEPEEVEAPAQAEAAGLQATLNAARDRVYEALRGGALDEQGLRAARDDVRAVAEKLQEADVPGELEDARGVLVGTVHELADRLDGAATSAAREPDGTIEQPALDRLLRRPLADFEIALDEFRDAGYDITPG